jgi:hypothetical protein
MTNNFIPTIPRHPLYCVWITTDDANRPLECIWIDPQFRSLRVDFGFTQRESTTHLQNDRCVLGRDVGGVRAGE